MEAHIEIPSIGQVWTPATDGHLYVLGKARAGKTTALKHWARELAKDSWEVWALGEQTEFAELRSAGVGVFGGGEVRQFEARLREICGQIEHRYEQLEKQQSAEFPPVAVIVDDLDRLLQQVAEDPELQSQTEEIRSSLATCQRIGRAVGVHVLKTMLKKPVLGVDEITTGKLVQVVLDHQNKTTTVTCLSQLIDFRPLRKTKKN